MSLKLNDLEGDRGAKQKRRRIARGEGSGWGKTAGRGAKGAQARSGGAKGGSFEGGQTPLTRRVPKYGFSNISFRVPRAEIRLSVLNRFDEGATVGLAELKQAGLVAKSVQRAKVIATGAIEKKLQVRLQGFTQGARSAIEAKGGSCEVVKE